MKREGADIEGLRSLAQEGIVGATALFATNMASTGLAAINSIIIARALGPQGYGEYSLVLTGLNILLLATGLGLPTSITYYVARAVSYDDFSAVSHILRKAAVITVINAIAVIVIGAWTVPFIAERVLGISHKVNLIASILPLVMVIPAVNLLSGLFFGIGRAGLSGMVNTVREMVRLLALLFIALSAALSLRDAVHIYIISYIISLLASIYLTLRALRRIGKQNVLRNEIKYKIGGAELLSYGLPFYVSSVIITMLGIYQNVLMVRTSSEAELAGMRASMNLLVAISLLASPIMSMALPVFSKADIKGSLRKVFRLSQALSSAIIVPFVLFFAIESSQLLELFYGREYSGYGSYFVILSISSLTVLIGSGIVLGALAGSGHPWKANTITFVELLCFIFSSYILSSRLGGIGVVMGITIGRWISAIYGYILALKVLHIDIDKWANFKLLLSSAVSAALGMALRYIIPFDLPLLLGLGISGLIVFGVYFVIVSMARPFRDHELDFLVLSLEGRGVIYVITSNLVKYYKYISRVSRGG